MQELRNGLQEAKVLRGDWWQKEWGVPPFQIMKLLKERKIKSSEVVKEKGLWSCGHMLQ